MRQEKILLPICQAGDPVLREKARHVSREEITTPAVQQLIANIKHTVAERLWGWAGCTPSGAGLGAERDCYQADAKPPRSRAI